MSDTVGRNFVESRVTFSRSTVRIQPGECHDVTQSYVRQYEQPTCDVCEDEAAYRLEDSEGAGDTGADDVDGGE